MKTLLPAVASLVALSILLVLNARSPFPIQSSQPAGPQNLLRIAQLFYQRKLRPSLNATTRKAHYDRLAQIIPQPAGAAALSNPNRIGRIWLHLLCVCHNHKYRWHLAGIWRELWPSKRNQKILPAAA